MRRTLWGFLSIIIFILGSPLVASAHGMVAGGSRIIEVDAGIHPIRIEAIIPTGAPTVLTLKILPKHQAVGIRTIRVTGRSATGITIAPQSVTAPAGAPVITVFDLPITVIGTWDVALTIDDERNTPGRVVLPVTILDTVVPLPTIPLFVSFSLLAVALAVQVLWVNAPAGVLSVARGLFVSALTLTLGFGVIAAYPQVRLEWTTPLPGPLPFISQTVSLSEKAVTFSLFDGSTGLPVDDLVPHHEALMHTVCIDETNHQLHHVHPARIAAGQFELGLTLLQPGAYQCINEVERTLTGSQILTEQITVPGVVVRGSEPGILTVPQRIAGYDVTVTAAHPIRVGVPVALTVDISSQGIPVAGIQPWLGMRGHLIVKSTNTSIYGHVHAVGTMDESFQPIMQPGNTVSFVYAFPQSGTYRLWFQLMCDDTLLTIPLTIVVPAEGA